MTDAEIIERLEAIANDPEDHLILYGEAYRNYYVQFAAHNGEMICEAVANQFVKPKDQLDETHLQVLEDLGWRRVEDSNWRRTFPLTREAFTEAVTLTRRAFTEAYGLPEDVELGTEPN